MQNNCFALCMYTSNANNLEFRG